MSKWQTEKFKAPPGKFRVIGVDTFEGPFADYPIDIVDTLAEAEELVKKRGRVMNTVYAYNDRGELVAHAGSY